MTTEYADFGTLTAALVPEVAEAFRDNTVMLNLVPTRNFAPNTASLKFTQRGSLDMAVVAEMANAAIGTYHETTTTITAQKAVAYTQLSDEAEEFGGERATPENMAQEGGLAAADRFDTDVLALADGFSQSAGSTGVNPTAATLLEALYKVRLSKAKGTTIVVLPPISIFDLQTDIITTTKTWINSVPLDILNGQPPQNNGLVGSMFNALIYESANCKSINTAADWAGLAFNPRLAFAAGLRRGFKFKYSYNVRGSFTEISVIMYYGIGEWIDAAGCLIVVDQ